MTTGSLLVAIALVPAVLSAQAPAPADDLSRIELRFIHYDCV